MSVKKRITAAIVSAVMAVSASVSAFAAGNPDVNGDGRITAKDALQIVKSIAAGTAKSSYDINGDGRVTPADALAVLRMTTSQVGMGGGSTTPTDEEFEAEVVRLINAERRRNGLPEFQTYDKLDRAADIRAEEIYRYYSHSRPDGRSCFTVFDEVGIPQCWAAENIAKGYGTPADVVNGWLNSDGHRSNILNMRYVYLGVGRKGNCWVQLFTDI